MNDEGKSSKRTFITVALAVLFVFAWLGTMFVLFPISNPIEKIGGTAGLGVFYAALLALGLLIIILLFMAIRSTLKDILKTVSDDLGVDIGQIGKDYKTIVVDSVLVAAGKKKKVSEHHDE